MKTLNNQTLLYDEDCPLCKVYTSGFISSKMLDTNGRKSFNQLSKKEQNVIDINRASNEIALVDTKNKTVIYGLDSLLKVIGHSFPIVQKIGKIKPIYFCLKKLYSFISYNRKVIIPSKIKSDETLQCVPTFNTKYRIIYVLFSLLITGLVLFQFSGLITKLPISTISREFILAFGQILFQGLFLLHFERKKTLNYIGNLMTVSLMGSLILIPLLILNSFINLSELFILIWFGATVGIMFIEHWRRVKLLELPKYLSFTWVTYRLLILLIILNL